MQGYSISLLTLIPLALLGTDYLIQKYLIIRGDLCEVLIGFVISGYFLAFIEKAHVLGHADIGLWLFTDDIFDSFEVASVVVLLVEGGCEAVIRGTIVIKGLLHIGRILYRLLIYNLTFHQIASKRRTYPNCL